MSTCPTILLIESIMFQRNKHTVSVIGNIFYNKMNMIDYAYVEKKEGGDLAHYFWQIQS